MWGVLGGVGGSWAEWGVLGGGETRLPVLRSYSDPPSGPTWRACRRRPAHLGVELRGRGAERASCSHSERCCPLLVPRGAAAAAVGLCGVNTSGLKANEKPSFNMKSVTNCFKLKANRSLDVDMGGFRKVRADGTVDSGLRLFRRKAERIFSDFYKRVTPQKVFHCHQAGLLC